MKETEIKESIETTLKQRENLTPKFVKQLEDKLKKLESKGYQERMVLQKK